MITCATSQTKQTSAYFMQAGGKIESDETPLQAVIREVNEELAEVGWYSVPQAQMLQLAPLTRDVILPLIAEHKINPLK